MRGMRRGRSGRRMCRRNPERRIWRTGIGEEDEEDDGCAKYDVDDSEDDVNSRICVKGRKTPSRYWRCIKPSFPCTWPRKTYRQYLAPEEGPYFGSPRYHLGLLQSLEFGFEREHA